MTSTGYHRFDLLSNSMAPYFYLSYARADRSLLIKRFYDDLVDTIRIHLGKCEHEAIGFYEDTVYEHHSEWTAESAKALRTSAVLVPLLSPAYLRDDHAGREWQIFEMRQQLQGGRLAKDLSASNFQSPVMPITWIDWQGSAPEVISKARLVGAHEASVHQEQPISTMLKLIANSAGTYAAFMRMLADSIIERRRVIQLPPLTSMPARNAVHNPFSRVEKPTTNLREAQEPRDGQKYSVWVVDDEPQFREVLKETCLYSGLFEVKIYRDPLSALRDVEMEFLQERQLPDLFVVDLVFDDSPMQGLQLIEELSQKKGLLSAILAISGYSDSRTLYEAVGAGATGALPKTYEGDLLTQLKWWAKLGRNRRLYHEGKFAMDAARKRQRVFLSYCSKDERIAKFLARNLDFRGIGVWYAPDTLEPGDDWRQEIQNALLSAKVFIPLITRNYANSPHCRGELANIINRFKSDRHEPLLLTPVLHDSTASELGDELIGQCLNYQWVTMPPARFIDGFAALFQRIQNFLASNP